MSEHELAGLRCADVRELSGAFVLGALEPAEADAVRRHLAACPEAHAEVAELGGVVPALFETVDVVAPPAALRDRILAAAEAERAMAQAPGPAVAPTAGPAPVADAPVDRAGWTFGSFFRRPFWAVAAAAALAGIVVLGAWNLQLRSDIDGLVAYREGVGQVLAQAGLPGSQLAVLASPDDPSGPSGLAAVGTDGAVAMVVRDLAPTTGTQVYEAWVIAGDAAPIPIGGFTVDGSRTASFATSLAAPGSGVTVALTLEPAEGATTPSLPIVALGTAGATEG